MVGTGGAQERGRGLARDAEGAATPLWRHACLPATDGPMATSLGVCAGLGRSARQGGGRNRPVVQGVVRDRRVRALHAACGNFKGGLGARGA
jgi:hypothetical protein